MEFGQKLRDGLPGRLSYKSHLIFRPRRDRKWDNMAIEPLDVVELHDLVVILGPPTLCLPLVKHLQAVNQNQHYNAIISNVQ